MPIDGSGNYVLPAAYVAVLNAVLDPDDHNTVMEDIQTALTACIKANGSKAFTSEQALSGNPVTALGAAPKQYVDAQALAAVASLKIKGSVLCATTGNISLTGEQTLDGQLTSASRVLVRAQTAPAENGIYVTGAGAWARATDMDAWATEIPGAIVAVEAGTLFADTVWLCTANAGGTLNTTAITFRRIDNQWKRNAQTGTTYTVLMADHNKHVTHSNGSAIATTLPQATTNFGDGFAYISENLGAGANTITPTTSTINGAATLVQKTGDIHLITSDGTNYRAIPLGLTYGQVTALTEDTSPDQDADFIVTEDASASLLKKAKMKNFAFFAGVVKFWGYVTVSAGTPTLQTSHNLTSITDTGQGILTATIATDFSSANWAPFCNVQWTATGPSDSQCFTTGIRASSIAAGSVAFDCYDQAAGQSYADPAAWSIMGLGTQ